jgi:hypothetical protein
MFSDPPPPPPSKHTTPQQTPTPLYTAAERTHTPTIPQTPATDTDHQAERATSARTPQPFHKHTPLTRAIKAATGDTGYLTGANQPQTTYTPAAYIYQTLHDKKHT